MMSYHVPNGKSLSVEPRSGCCSCHLRWCCTTQMAATSLSTPAFAKPSCSLGLKNAPNGHGDVEHMLSMQKGSRYTLDASSKTCSRTSSDAFFLRPYLTREEYIYWNSHFNHTQPKCTRHACTGPTELTTTMIYQQKHSPASIQSFAGVPSTAGRPSISFLAPQNHCLAADCACRQERETELYHIPKTSSDFINKGGRKNADYSPHKYPTYCITERSDNDYSAKEKPIVGKSSSKRMALSARQLDTYYQNLSLNYINSTRSCGTQHETTSKSLRRLSEKYLCGDKSFDEIPHTLASKATSKGKNIKSSARSAPVLCDSTSTSGLRLKEKLSNSYTLKRKNIMESEHGRDNPKRKRLTVDNDASGLHQAQSLNGTIDLNECLTQYLGGSFPENDRKARIETSTPQSTKISQTYGIGDGAERTSDACEIDKLTPKEDYSKRAGSGKVNKVIQTAQPIQRTLLNDTENTVSFGYALDYDCLPKVVGVMSSKQDVVIPGFQKQVR